MAQATIAYDFEPRRLTQRIGHGNVMTYTVTRITELPAVAKDGRFTAWLGDVSRAGRHLSGTDPLCNFALLPVLRKAFRAGFTPYEAIKAVQTHYARSTPAVASNVTLHPCIGCHTPNVTRGGMYCPDCREAR